MLNSISHIVWEPVNEHVGDNIKRSSLLKNIKYSESEEWSTSGMITTAAAGDVAGLQPAGDERQRLGNGIESVRPGSFRLSPFTWLG